MATPLLAGPRGVPQEALVVRPLPLDISKLPLESSQSEALLNVYAPNNQPFPSSGQHLEPTVPGENHLVTLPLEPGTPSHQTKVRYWCLLVSLDLYSHHLTSSERTQTHLTSYLQ